MYPTTGFFSFWWIIPIVMMLLCFLMMRGRWGSIMCGSGPCGIRSQETKPHDSAIDILNMRYASGEIEKAEYEEMKKTISKPSDLKLTQQ